MRNTLLKNKVKQLMLEYVKQQINIEINDTQFSLNIDDANIVHIKLYFNVGEFSQKLKKYIEQNLDEEFSVLIEQAIRAHKIENLVQGKPNIKNIIAISSAKGGVGKSTLALNIAVAMQQLGAKVGIVDADIHGPSQPTMQGVSNHDLQDRTSGLHPVSKYNIESASISYFMTNDDPVVWRGPMVSRALEQLIHDIKWGELDYLFIDMPPGTGDLPLTLVKKLPLTAALVITTPQDIAYIDAKKSAEMFIKTKIPLLGVVENMSSFSCEYCGRESKIFGEGGGLKLANEVSLPLMAKVPLTIEIRECSDIGIPVAIKSHDIAHIYQKISLQIGSQLSLRELDFMRNSSS